MNGGPVIGTIHAMDQSVVLQDYDQLRRAGVELSARLVRSLSSDEIGAAAEELGMGQGKFLNLETEDELGVLMDYAIYNIHRDGRNAVARMLEEQPPPEDSIDMRLLRSMQQARHTILDVAEVIPGFAVRALDIFNKISILLVDRGYSSTAHPGAVLATRMHSPGEGWWITCGAGLPLNTESRDQIVYELDNYRERYNSPFSEHPRTRMIIRACRAAGASRQIAYAGPGGRISGESARAFPGAVKIGRNDPCPCGSGKKYKKCCGR